MKNIRNAQTYYCIVAKPERYHMGDAGAVERIILKWILNIYIYIYICCEGEHCGVHLAHDRAKWWDIMNMLKTFQITGETERFLVQ